MGADVPASGSKNINIVSKISHIVISKNKNLKCPLEKILTKFKIKLDIFNITAIKNVI